MTDKIIRVKIEAGDSQQQINQLDSSMVKLGASTDNATEEVGQLSTQLTRAAQGVKDATTSTGDSIRNLNRVSATFGDAGLSVGDFGRQAGMAGMQMQQFVGQVTAGTNPLTALAQQAADIGFVLGAPLVGAIVGIAAAIGSVLLPALIDGTSETEKLDDALQSLRATSGTTEDGIYTLNEQIVNLAESSSIAAKVKLADNLIKARDAAVQASRAFEDAFDVGRLQFAVDTYSSGVGGLVGVSNEVVGVSRKIGEQFGLQGAAAIKFGVDVSKAIGDIQKTPTTGNFDKFINLISGQAAQTGTQKTTALAGALLDLASTGRKAAQEAGNAQKSIDDLATALENSKSKTGDQSDASEAFIRRLQLQNITLKNGELAADLQAAAWAEGKESVDELDAATKALVIENHNLAASQKYLAESLKENNDELDRQVRLDADAARRAERDRQRINERIANMRLETQTLSAETELQRAVLEGKFSAEEAQLAQSYASKVLSATTEYQTLLDLAKNNDELKLQAEESYQERLAALRQQYADSQMQLVQSNLYAEGQYAQQLQNIQMNSAVTALNGISSFAKQGSALQKGLFLAVKGIQAAQAYTSGLTAAMLARATIPYPYSEPIALAQITAGKVSAAAIMATGIAGTFSGGGGGSIGGGSIPSSASATMPTTPQAAATVNTLEIVGLTELKEELRNNEGMVSTRFVASILDKIDDANRLRGQA